MKMASFSITAIVGLIMAFDFTVQPAQAMDSSQAIVSVGTNPTRVKITRDEAYNIAKINQTTIKDEFWYPMVLFIAIKGIKDEESASLILTASDPQSVITKPSDTFCEFMFCQEGNQPIYTFDFSGRENISGVKQDKDIGEGISYAGDTWMSEYHLYVYADSDSFANPAFITLEIPLKIPNDERFYGPSKFLQGFKCFELKKKVQYQWALPKDSKVGITVTLDNIQL